MMLRLSIKWAHSTGQLLSSPWLSMSHRVCIKCMYEIDPWSYQPLPNSGPLSYKDIDNWTWECCIMCRPRRKSRPSCIACVECGKKGYMASQLLLKEDGVMASWIGRTWARCFSCSEFDDLDKFVAAAKARWDQHDQAVFPEGIRIDKVCNAMQVLENAFPGASQWELLMLTSKRREAAAMALATALDYDSNECLRAAGHVGEQYFEQIRAAAANPTYRATRDVSAIISAEAAYLNKIAQGVAVCFVVVCTGCDLVALRDQVDSNSVQCSRCNKFYSPRKTRIGTAQKVISMTDPNSGLGFCFPWLDSEEDGARATNMMAMSAASEILAGGIGEDLEDFVQRSVVSLSDFLAKVAIPIGFKLSAGMQDVECLEIWGELSRLLANVLAGAKVLGSKKI